MIKLNDLQKTEIIQQNYQEVTVKSAINIEEHLDSILKMAHVLEYKVCLIDNDKLFTLTGCENLDEVVDKVHSFIDDNSLNELTETIAKQFSDKKDKLRVINLDNFLCKDKDTGFVLKREHKTLLKNKNIIKTPISEQFCSKQKYSIPNTLFNFSGSLSFKVNYNHIHDSGYKLDDIKSYIHSTYGGVWFTTIGDLSVSDFSGNFIFKEQIDFINSKKQILDSEEINVSHIIDKFTGDSTKSVSSLDVFCLLFISEFLQESNDISELKTAYSTVVDTCSHSSNIAPFFVRELRTKDNTVKKYSIKAFEKLKEYYDNAFKTSKQLHQNKAIIFNGEIEEYVEKLKNYTRMLFVHKTSKVVTNKALIEYCTDDNIEHFPYSKIISIVSSKKDDKFKNRVLAETIYSIKKTDVNNVLLKLLPYFCYRLGFDCNKLIQRYCGENEDFDRNVELSNAIASYRRTLDIDRGDYPNLIKGLYAKYDKNDFKALTMMLSFIYYFYYIDNNINKFKSYVKHFNECVDYITQTDDLNNININKFMVSWNEKNFNTTLNFLDLLK